MKLTKQKESQILKKLWQFVRGRSLQQQIIITDAEGGYFDGPDDNLLEMEIASLYLELEFERSNTSEFELKTDRLDQLENIKKRIDGFNHFEAQSYIEKLLEDKMLSEDIVELILKYDLNFFPTIPSEFLSEGIVIVAAGKNEGLIKDIPDHLFTETVCNAIVRKGIELSRLIPKQFWTENIYLKLIQKDGGQLSILPEKYRTKRFYQKLIKADNLMINKINTEDVTEELVLFAVRECNMDVHLIKESYVSESAVLTLIKENLVQIRDVDPNILTEEMAFYGMVNNPFSINYIPTRLHTEGLFIRVIDENVDIFEYIDDDLKTYDQYMRIAVKAPTKIDEIHFRLVGFCDEVSIMAKYNHLIQCLLDNIGEDYLSKGVSDSMVKVVMEDIIPALATMNSVGFDVLDQLYLFSEQARAVMANCRVSVASLEMLDSVISVIAEKSLKTPKIKAKDAVDTLAALHKEGMSLSDIRRLLDDNLFEKKPPKYKRSRIEEVSL